jgi:hypothetical protein
LPCVLDWPLYFFHYNYFFSRAVDALATATLDMNSRLFLSIGTCVALSASTLSAASSAECSGPEYHQFDFWIGQWDIKQKILKADATWFEADAHTNVSPILGGCALMEEWQGDVLFFWEGMEQPEPLKGFSVRAFDRKTNQWTISWMDTRHLRFSEFEGNFHDGRGEFFRKRLNEEKKETVTRITFSEIKPASVRWDLAVSSDDGQNWKTLWIMQMTRPNKPADKS